MVSGEDVQCMAIFLALIIIKVWKSGELGHSATYGKAQLFFNIYTYLVRVPASLDEMMQDHSC